MKPEEKHRNSLADIGAGQPLTGSDQWPESLTQLVERSLQLHHRILKLDAMLVARQGRRAIGKPI